jgi:hypothetical protein
VSSLDDDNRLVWPGDRVSFSYGIPPVAVIGQVVLIDGERWVETPGHSPARCRLSELRDFVGSFYLEK